MRVRPLTWRDRLEQLRREQNPGRYNDDRPTLQLPIPAYPEPPDDWPDPQPTPSSESDGVIILDL